MKFRFTTGFTILITLIFALFPLRNVQAADSYITINLSYTTSNAFIYPSGSDIYSGNGPSSNSFAGSKPASNGYTVSCNLSSVKYVKKNGKITGVKVKKSEAAGLIINISPENSSDNIVCNNFAPDSTSSYSTASSYKGEDRSTQRFVSPAEGYLGSSSGIYCDVGVYKYEQWFSYDYIWSDDYSYLSDNNGNVYYPLSYTIAAQSGYTAISINNITNAEKSTESTITVTFSMYSDITTTDKFGSGYIYASNGSSSITKNKGNNNSISTWSASVSTNNNADLNTNVKLTNLRNALKSFEKYIDLSTTFYIAASILTSILVIIINIFNLAVIPSHPIKRRQTIENLICSLLCLALTGGTGLFIKLIIQIIFV